MGMTATNMVSGPDWEIRLHAMERRLEAEGATPAQIFHTLRNDADRLKEAIRDELSEAVQLSIYARRLFMDPGREAYLGRRYGSARSTIGRGRKADLIRIVNGRAVRKIIPTRRGRGDYFYTGHVVYVVSGRLIVTAYIPNTNQAETLDRLVDMPHRKPLRHLACALEECQPIDPVTESGNESHIVSMRDILPQEIGVFRGPFEMPLPKWMLKDGADWTMLVAHEQGARATLRDLFRMLRINAPGKRPSVYVERSTNVVNWLMSELKPDGSVGMRLIPMPGVNCPYMPSAGPNTYIRRWWRRMQKTSPEGGRLLMVVSAETARMVLELVDAKNRMAWRGNRRLFESGSTINLRWPAAKRGYRLELKSS